MTTEEITLARIFFENKVRKSDGNAFEDLFTQIMNYAEPDFEQIKPWGNIGDRKNDGFIRSKGIFYQVFAPEDINNVFERFWRADRSRSYHSGGSGLGLAIARAIAQNQILPTSTNSTSLTEPSSSPFSS